MQSIFSRIILTVVFVVALSSCDKAPRHVIGERDMVDLLVDIHEAESLIDMYPQTYGRDSMRKVLKQQVTMASALKTFKTNYTNISIGILSIHPNTKRVETIDKFFRRLRS